MNAFSDLLAPLMPVVLQVVSALLGVLLIRLTGVAKERWGIEIEARHRETLHSALMTGITAALSKGVTNKQAIAAAVSHAVQRGAPDAIKRFGLSEMDLADMAQAKLQDALSAMPWVGVDAPEIGAEIADTGDIQTSAR
ncbi:hypothetical protein [Antarcticimicrobium sediminis]|uniref:Bacteriophage holin of superfamily 6 (Holin_LLH) n=1 Tax=Antarcticimicrobium sediminis TaxID=2546227 RepID=A0A4R5F0Q2_9RHOB|nr:hypothetical protein [Antarcticimicrobium sediminis]TDE40943.1 hypothetical protein E1B25_01645 [Antarcticimicrobium sediminis]